MALSDYLQDAEAGQIVQVYDLNIGQEFYYYTSHEKDITFNAINYEAIPIETQGFTSDVKMKPTPMKLSMNLTEPAIRYVANTPAEIIKVKITDFLKTDPTENEIFYSGRVMSVEIDEKGISLNCESKTDVFRQKIPNVIHSSLCNNILFDSVCQVNENLFSFDSVLSTIVGSTLVSSTFALFPDGYFKRGKIKTAYGDIRMVTNHVGDIITIQLPFDSRLLPGNTVVAVAGCDRKRTTCDVKFNNLVNNVSMPEIPSHNPAVWGVEGTK